VSAKRFDVGRYFLAVVLQREMAGVEQVEVEVA